MQVNLSVLNNSDQKKVAVISHERSGTHFLMNSIAQNYRYLSNPWWNFDFELGLNFHSAQAILNYLQPVENRAVLNILKSHHSADFFIDCSDYLFEQFQVLYIYRHPLDVLSSFWKLIRYFKNKGWNEGPLTQSISEFIATPPCNALLRYQTQQTDTMVHRWRDHVEGWMTLARNGNPDEIKLLSYENLNESYEDTVRSVGDFLNQPQPDRVTRPDRQQNVVRSDDEKINALKAVYDENYRDYIKSVAGPLIDILGYQV